MVYRWLVRSLASMSPTPYSSIVSEVLFYFSHANLACFTFLRCLMIGLVSKKVNNNSALLFLFSNFGYSILFDYGFCFQCHSLFPINY
jgi:hypothetical protein